MSSAHHYFDARRLLALWDPETESATIADALGVSVATVKKWRCARCVLLDPYKADKYAIRAGTHPARVWGDEWWTAALAVA